MATAIIKFEGHESLQYLWLSMPFLPGWNGSDSSSADRENQSEGIYRYRVIGYLTWALLVALCIAYGLEMLLYAEVFEQPHTSLLFCGSIS